MKVDGNIQALRNIGTRQQVSANNLANVNSDGFKASRTVQQGDSVSISPEARAATLNANGEALSNSDIGSEMVNMSIYGAAFSANINAIQTQDEMAEALLNLKK